MLFAKLHPLLVHFPIGLLISGTLLEFFGRIQKEEEVLAAGQFNIRLGFWCAFPVMAVGLLGVRGLEIGEKIKPILSSHIMFAFSTTLTFALALIVYRFRNRVWVDIFYNLLLAAGLFCALGTGYFGGEMAHRFGVAGLDPAN